MERTVSSNLVPKKYDEAFRRQAVEMVLRGGKTVEQAAGELGLSPYLIYEWKRKLLPTALAR
jgi:transposase-like protein